MDDLIIDNLKLVHYVIKKMNIYNSNDYDDYYQAGVIGLMNAIRHYNSDFKTTFSTYAYICIKNEILKCIGKNTLDHLSLEDKIFDDIRIEDTLIDDDIDVVEKLIINETNEELYLLLKRELNDLERKVIFMSFGLGCREYKQKEIGDILGIPQYKVSRIRSDCLKRLKNCMIR